MSKRSDLLKSIIKDPSDITEDATLNTFLKSRGLNPLHVSKDQKVAHSKMGEFLKWKRNHMFSRPVSEAVDKKDTVTFDIPLLIRVLELTREDIKSDVDLHRVVERLIQIRNKGVLTMADYRMIATLPNIRTKHVNENHVAIAMGNMLDDEGSMVLNQIEELERGCAMIRDYIGKDYEKQLPAWVQSKVTLATDYMSTVGNYLSSKSEKVKEEIEFQEASHDPWKDKHFGPTKIIKQKYHVKTDTKSYNVKADNEEHAHKLVTKHAPGSKIVSIEHKGRMMEEIEQIDELKKSTLASYAKKATDDATYHSFSAGTRSAKDPERLKDDEKAMKRQSGVNKVIDRLAKEEIEPIDEISKELTHSYLKKRYAQTGATRQDKPKGMSRTTHDKQLMGLNRATRRLTTTLELPKGTDLSQGGKYTADSVEIEGTPIQEGSAALRLAQALRKEREARELKDKSREAAERNEKKPAKLDNVFGITGQALKKENTMDSLAATGAPNDGANSPDDVAPKDKNKKLIQMSKSARIIKNLYKQKGMKEETFDTEKEDKSVATYGKKPKLTDNKKKIDAVGSKSSAAAIMTGGTTLTGTPRDTIEIDPMMQLKPGLMGQSGQAMKPKNNNR